MKANQWKPLFRSYLLPHLPHFKIRGSLLYAEPVEWLLRGFSFETSGWDSASFYLWFFVQPLYIPSDHIYFLFGKRIADSNLRIEQGREEECMSVVLDFIQQQGISFIEQVHTPEDLANKARTIHPSPSDPNVCETIAYSLILSGRYDDADKELKRLLAYLEPQATSSWDFQQMGRLYSIHQSLLRDPMVAVQKLQDWRDYTVLHLQLDRKMVKEYLRQNINPLV